MNNDPFLPLLESVLELWPIGLTGAGAVLLARNFPALFQDSLERPGKETARMHDRFVVRSLQELRKVREMVPLQNPARVFGYLRKVNPLLFEEMILTELARRGLPIVRNASYSGDGGVDGRFRLDGQMWFIQAKRYARHVKEPHIWAFEAICQKAKVKGIFVHTGRTPERVKALARQAGCVRVISGDELLQLFSGHPVKLEASPAPPASPAAATATTNLVTEAA